MSTTYWLPAWEPHTYKTDYQNGGSFKTQISTFDNGKEQRRKKMTVERHRFIHSFDCLTEAELLAIYRFWQARYGAWEAFYYPNWGEILKGTRISTEYVSGGYGRIKDSSGGFLTAGFAAGQKVVIGKSTASPVSNDGIYTIYSAAAGILTLSSTDNVFDETAKTELTVFRTYLVRFVDDNFWNRFKLDNLGYTGSLEMIEDL